MKFNSIKMMVYKLLWNNKDCGLCLNDFVSLIDVTKIMVHQEINNLRKLGVKIESRNNRYYML